MSVTAFRKLCLYALLLLPVLAGTGLATAAQEEDPLAALLRQLDAVERTLKRPDVSIDELNELLKTVTGARAPVNACLNDRQAALDKVQADIDSLGEPARGEAAEVAAKRRELARSKKDIEQHLARCRVLALRIDELANRIQTRSKEAVAEELFARQPTALALVIENLKTPGVWLKAVNDFVRHHSGLEQLEVRDWLVLVILFPLALAVGIRIRKRLLAWIRQSEWPREFSSRFVQALVATLGHYAPQVLVMLAAAGFFYYQSRGADPMPFTAVLSYSVLIFFVAVAVLRLLLWPPSPARLYLPLTPGIARGLARRLTVLALLLLIGYLLFDTTIAQSLPEPALMLARSVIALLWILNLIWALLLLRRSPKLQDFNWLFLIVILALALSLPVEWAGYRNLAVGMRRYVLGVFLALGAFLLLAALFRGFFEALEAGTTGWARRFRRFLGIRTGQRVPGLFWIRVTVAILLWSGFGLTVMRVWGVSDTVFSELYNYVVNGFSIGTLQIVPIKILIALVLFAVLMAIGGWVKKNMERQWLKGMPIERGAREALVAISGYAMIAIAAIVSLSLAGLDFSKIALIAGALSVGIGFGLQNIVNNFISGLILLFERPIRTGDWIVVGNTEGYVKRIRIRSTQIQTFDRADVIVPNSELISQQVTNWVLSNPVGRIVVPVGVAYGSDVQQVREILERVANEHPDIIRDARAPAPYVLFRGFGDSSLDFELRAYVVDIDRRLRVISDINFAIDAAFREAGIEIPFPQRDVHVRSLPDSPGADGAGGSAIRPSSPET